MSGLTSYHDLSSAELLNCWYSDFMILIASSPVIMGILMSSKTRVTG